MTLTIPENDQASDILVNYNNIQFLHVTITAKMAHLNEIFVSTVVLKCTKLENKTIFSPICEIYIHATEYVLEARSCYFSLKKKHLRNSNFLKVIL